MTTSHVFHVYDAKIYVEASAYGKFPGEGYLGIKLGNAVLSLHSMKPEQIMDLGRRIETAGAELANRMLIAQTADLVGRTIEPAKSQDTADVPY